MMLDRKKVVLPLLLLCILTMIPKLVFALTLGDIADQIISLQYIPNIAKYIFSPIAYVAGIVFVIKSLLKFKEVGEGDRQAKILAPIIYFICGGIFLALPSMMGIGVETLGLNLVGGSDTSESQVGTFGY